MATRTCGYSCKSYGPSYRFGLPSSTHFEFTSLLENVDELFKSLKLLEHPTFTPNTNFITLFIAKYQEENCQRIFKTVPER